jgi:hypothetical protein
MHGTMSTNTNIGAIPRRGGRWRPTAEVTYRPSMAQAVTGNRLWELQNRAHAMFNDCYGLAP